MKWFAIRTKPGSQVPRRERWKEPSASALKGHTQGRGYRIVSSTNPERSGIEDALAAKGFTFYMPAEFVAVRKRDKKGLYEMRRFALMKGYAFILGAGTDEELARLRKIRFVQGVVANEFGRPYAIGSMDMFRLRMYEQNSRAEAVAKVAALSKNVERQARDKKKAIAKAARKKMFPGREVRLIWGDKVGRDATVAAWADQENVRVILQGLDESETITVAFEFLKTSDAA